MAKEQLPPIPYWPEKGSTHPLVAAHAYSFNCYAEDVLKVSRPGDAIPSHAKLVLHVPSDPPSDWYATDDDWVWFKYGPPDTPIVRYVESGRTITILPVLHKNAARMKETQVAGPHIIRPSKPFMEMNYHEREMFVSLIKESLPPLTGTDKQIAWATRLRGVVMPDENARLADEGEYDRYVRHAIAALWPPAASASWWIDIGRYIEPYSLDADAPERTDPSDTGARKEFRRMLDTGVPALKAALDAWAGA